jgi:hypothetical protein
MTAKERKELQTIRSEFAFKTPVAEIARKIKVTKEGFPHRVVALLRKECQDNNDE